MWREALVAKFEPKPGMKPFGRAEFDNLLGNWGATTDIPPSAMAEDLLAAYPEAKVILVERDVESWFKSYSDTVINGVANPFIPLACKIDKMYIGQMGAQMDLQVKHVFDVQVPRAYGLINNPEYFTVWRKKAKDVYRAHNEKIKRITPTDQLLLFNLEDGWEPLCRFLGKPIPDVPFPRVNETAALQEKVNLYVLEGYKRSARRFAKKAGPWIIAVGAAVIWWAYR